MRKQFKLLDSGPAFALVGVVAATFAVSDPGSRVAVPVIALIGIGLTVMLAGRQGNPERVEFLRNLMLFGLGARLIAFALIHMTVGPYVFAPDALTYEGWGDALLAFFKGDAPFPERLEDTLQLAYPTMNAALFAVFGPARAAPGVANMFFSCWTALPIYHLVLVIVRRNEVVARWAAVLTVLFPSMILWSLLNVREAPAILTIAITLYFFARVQQEFSLKTIAGVVIGLGVLTLFREYLSSLVAGGGVAGLLMGRGRSPKRMLVVGSVALLTLTLAAQSFGLGGTLTGEAEVLQEAQAIRVDFQFNASSAYGAGADITSVGGALAFLPIGLLYFLFAPFPWQITSILQAITLPEMLVWYALMPFAWRGVRLAFRHDLRAYTPLMAIFIVVTFSYALVEANVGTAYRHRAQVLPIAFVFCAVGLSDWYAVRTQRRARKRSVAGNATVRTPGPQAARGPVRLR